MTLMLVLLSAQCAFSRIFKSLFTESMRIFLASVPLIIQHSGCLHLELYLL